MLMPDTSASPLPVVQQALHEIVREMGFTKLKPKQLEATVAVVSGNDTFVWVTASQGSSGKNTDFYVLERVGVTRGVISTVFLP